MGITGLIPFLEKSSSKVHVKVILSCRTLTGMIQLLDLQGCTVAVDTYCWLHKGVFSCADKLCRGEDTDMYVTYCLKYVDMLLSYNIKPILVFDGRHLPAKALTEKRRRENRENSRKRAAELLRLGKTAEAHSQMRRCIDVTHAMALRLIKECRLRNVDCIVAPYEADAQMAFLNKLDIAQYVITEDSDLTLFGCKKIIFKLDLTGAGLLVEADKLYLSMGCRQEKYTFDKFRTMCILSGCDYLNSLPGIGLAKACKFVLMTEEDNMQRALPKIPQYLNKRNLEVNGDYVENFLKADATFKHMFVYNPLQRRMERLNDLSVWDTDERYCSNAGEMLDEETAFQLALGNLNPFSLKVLDTWNPDQSQTFSNVKRTKHKSIWQSDYRPHSLADKKQPVISFAMQFKKVNLSRLRENEDIDEKPEDGDILAMYNEPQPPKKRFCRESESETKPIQQVTPTKTTYNPFPMVSPREKTCISDMIIRSSRKVPPINPFKRSIFTTTTEVRSRFFASNVSLAGDSEFTTETKEENIPKEPQKTAEEIIEQVTRIEELTKENDEKKIALYDYNSPSPIRSSLNKPKPEASPLSSLVETAVKLENESPTQIQIPPSFDSGICSASEENATEISELETGEAIKVKEEYEKDNVIELSDDEGKKPIPAFQRLTTPKKKQTAKTRTLGLSKVKKTNTASSSKVSSNQTRLSMFGFQKKPSIK